MRILNAALAAAFAFSLTVPALACDKDKTAKADQAKQQQTSQTTHSQDTAKDSHGGG